MDLQLSHLGAISIWQCLENASSVSEAGTLPGVLSYNHCHSSKRATMSGSEGSPYKWKPQESWAGRK